jgi:hypothetical protein
MLELDYGVSNDSGYGVSIIAWSGVVGVTESGCGLSNKVRLWFE